MKYLGVLLGLLFCFSCQETAVEKSMAQQLEQKFKESKVPAVVMGKITKEGDMEFFSFGPAQWDQPDPINENTIFDIASMTKAITTVAILQLVEQGLLTLDEPLDRLMPELAALPILDAEGKTHPAENVITLRQLLTHTSGLGYWFSSKVIANSLNNNIEEEYWPAPDVVAQGTYDWAFGTQPRRVFEAGTQWMYGRNLGIVGRLVERLSGQDLESYFSTHIFQPLGMNSTAFNLNPEQLKRKASVGLKDPISGEITEDLTWRRESEAKSFYGGGGLKSSAKDYATFLLCLLNKGTWKGATLLQEATVTAMMQPQLEGFTTQWEAVESKIVSTDNTTYSFLDSKDNFSLAWAIESNPEESIRPQGAGYWAGIFNSYYTIDPEKELALVYFTQYLPFNDEASFSLYKAFEEQIYTQSIP